MLPTVPDACPKVEELDLRYFACRSVVHSTESSHPMRLILLYNGAIRNCTASDRARLDVAGSPSVCVAKVMSTERAVARVALNWRNLQRSLYRPLWVHCRSSSKTAVANNSKKIVATFGKPTCRYVSCDSRCSCFMTNDWMFRMYSYTLLLCCNHAPYEWLCRGSQVATTHVDIAESYSSIVPIPDLISSVNLT